jgi:hypothetical protein
VKKKLQASMIRRTKILETAGSRHSLCVTVRINHWQSAR